MHSVALEAWVVFLLLETLWVRLSVLLRRVARRRQALFTSFCAFESDDFNFALLSHGRNPFVAVFVEDQVFSIGLFGMEAFLSTLLGSLLRLKYLEGHRVFKGRLFFRSGFKPR